MYKVGLTGGIGSGKTKVADLLATWGATVIDTDAIAHALTAPEGEAIAPIRAAFGPDFIAANGAMDRTAMRQHVFSNPQARHQLEAILHPLIGAETRRQAEAASGLYCVFVVPLLVEAGERWRHQVDRICVVDCDPATQIARVQARSGLTPDAIERIMQVQASRQARLVVADDIIVNDATTTLNELVQRSRQCHEQWCQAAQAG